MSGLPIGRDPGPVADAAAAAAQRAADRATEHARLRRAAKDLEGVFVEQLFKAMRETVPEGGMVGGGNGEEMFTTLLDQRLSALTPERWEGGLGSAVYRQLGGTLPPGPAPRDPGPSSAAPVAPILEASSSPDATRPEPT